MIAVAVAVDATQTVAVRLGPVSVSVPGAAYQRGQQHHDGAQVVLDRVGEEDGAEQKAGEGKAVGGPVAAAADLRLRHEVDEAMDDGDDRDEAQDEGPDEDAVEEDAPGELAALLTRPHQPAWILSLRHQAVSST